jgi:hypothetical protein
MLLGRKDNTWKREAGGSALRPGSRGVFCFLIPGFHPGLTSSVALRAMEDRLSTPLGCGQRVVWAGVLAFGFDTSHTPFRITSHCSKYWIE